jgi:hypothetical protein
MPPKGGNVSPARRKARSSKRPDMNSIKVEIYITGSSVVVALVVAGAWLGHVQGV